MRDLFDLTGKTALITGGANGMGRMIAEGLVAAGASVIVTSRHAADAQDAASALSDMAAPTTGHKQTDHMRIMSLCEIAAQFAVEVLAPGGTFLAKVLRGGTENELLVLLKRHFQTVRHVKPKASRADSAEMYVLAQGFKGRSASDSADAE